MKIVAAVLIVLLIALLGGAGFFYLKIHQPMAADLARYKGEQPQMEKISRELKARKDREAQETAWIAPAVEALRTGLAAAGIASDKTEIAVTGNRIVVNIAETVLYTPQSVTFANTSRQALDGIADMLKPLKDLEIVVGNVTEAAPAQGKGRKRVPAKDARSLAAGRSLELVKYLEKKGLAPRLLAAAAFPAKMPDQGFRMKAGKTMIVISSLAQAAPPSQAPATTAVSAPATTGKTSAAAPKTETKPAPASQGAATAPAAPPPPKPVPIPITPAPKKVP